MTQPNWLLLVDDDADIRAVLGILLRQEGYVVVEATDGLDALEKIRSRGKPALVLLDLRMPRMSGPEFMAALREEHLLADMPVVVISGDGRARESVKAMSAAGFLQKPLEADLLVRTVRSFVTKPREPTAPPEVSPIN